MKIVAINSSFRKEGNTEHVLRLMEEILNEKAGNNQVNIEFDYVSLSDMNLSVCRGCRICFIKGEEYCPLKDNLADLISRLKAADGIILGSPVYVEDVNGIMKNFIDRLAFFCHRPALAGKSALVITTSGSTSTVHSLRTMTNALRAWGAYISAQGTFRMGAAMKVEEVNNQFSRNIITLTERFFTSIVRKKPYNPDFYAYMVFKIQQKYREMEFKKHKELNKVNFDDQYWDQQGWLDPKCDFYIPHKPAVIKSKTAHILGGLITRILK